MKFKEKPLKTFDELFEFYNLEFARKNRQWVFRGLPDACYKLETTLERARKRFNKSSTDARDMESKMIRLFKRRAHLYLESPPKDDDTIEWLALMQHFGAPTRLLDWTYSFFVALFFAVEKTEKRCALWAIDMDRVICKAESRRKDDFRILRDEDPYLKSGLFFDVVFNKRQPDRLVYSLNPDRLNERLTVQQGLFLAPTDINSSFEANLEGNQKNDSNAENYVWKITIYDDVNSRCEILKQLHRMNINSASLFPDLGGFAKSLSL